MTYSWTQIKPRIFSPSWRLSVTESRHLYEESSGVIGAVLIKKNVLPRTFLWGDGGAFVDDMFAGRVTWSTVNYPTHWKQRSPDSFLREYCKWSEIQTGTEHSDYILTLSNYYFSAKRHKKNYGKMFIFPWCSCNLKPRLREDGAEFSKQKPNTKTNNINCVFSVFWREISVVKRIAFRCVVNKPVGIVQIIRVGDGLVSRV